MKIKTRILLYNTLMVFLSLIALLIIGMIVITFWERNEDAGPKSLMIAFLTVGFVSIGVILSISYIFTHNILKHIGIPLAALTQGAGRVELGDLSQAIAYDGSDDFKIVCDSFDRMQQHLKDERDKNAAYEKARADLVRGISHDLRTPLTSVKGYIKGIQDGVANTPEKEARYLQTAYDKSCEMDQLLQRLFFFSRMESGSLPLSTQAVDLDDMIRYYVDESSLDPRLQGVEFRTSYSPERHISMIDIQHARRVLDNLTDNALKYSGASPLVIDVRVESDGKDNVITFADNGVGVGEDVLPHIFEQFYRADTARQDSGNSNGIGLYVVKYIVESHGGSISAESDGGLKMVIRLPKAQEVDKS